MTQGSYAIEGPTRAERLPFTVQVVTTEEDLSAAVAVRSEAYQRHRAPAADRLNVPEEEDRRDDSIVLLARSRLDGEPVGSLRLTANFLLPMCFQKSVDLPDPLMGERSVELMRLAVMSGPTGRLVTNALAKAAYQICMAGEIRFSFVAARRPLDAVYKRFRFTEVREGLQAELDYAPGVPHSILFLDVPAADDRWLQFSPDVHRFFIETDHPEINLDKSEVARRFRRVIDSYCPDLTVPCG